MVNMTFKNENTFVELYKKGEVDKYHAQYEDALKLIKLGEEYPNIIDGNDIFEDKKFNDLSPIDGKTVIGIFQLASPESIDRAINRSKENYKKWFDLGYAKRSKIFLKAADILSSRKFYYAALLAYENGKNRDEAIGDVDEAIDFMRYYALDLKKNKGYIHATGKAYDNEESKSIMKPYGLFAVLPPFNFFSITVGMFTGALITGNAAILKPSSDIPLSSYLFTRLLLEAGVPSNVIHYVSGSGSVVGRILVEDPRIDGVVFTGSRDVGLYIYNASARIKIRPVITEMGGKNCIIVSDKADLEKAAEGVAKAAFGYDGQKCSACSKLLVNKNIKEEFIKKLVNYVENKITIGDPREKGIFMGPLINKEAFEKYKKYIDVLKADGKVLTGCDILPRDGYYVKPTVVDGLQENHEIMKTELFLPIMVVEEYSTLDEAIKIINSSDYGLTGGIFTESTEEINQYFHNADVGVIYANRRRGGSTGAMVGSQPFVGWKMSGSTGKGTGSFYYLQQFLREQSQTIVRE